MLLEFTGIWTAMQYLKRPRLLCSILFLNIFASENLSFNSFSFSICLSSLVLLPMTFRASSGLDLLCSVFRPFTRPSASVSFSYLTSWQHTSALPVPTHWSDIRRDVFLEDSFQSSFSDSVVERPYHVPSQL